MEFSDAYSCARSRPITISMSLQSGAYTMAKKKKTYYAPNFEKVDGAYCCWSVGAWVTLFVPTVTFKPLKLES